MKRQNIYCRTKRGSQETTGGIGVQHTEKRSTAAIPQAALEVCTLTGGQLPGQVMVGCYGATGGVHSQASLTVKGMIP